MPPPTTTQSPNTTPWWSSPTPPARGSMWAIPGPTPPWISWPASAGCRVITSSTPWGGTPSACPPKTTPSKTTSIPPNLPRRTSPTSRPSCGPWGFPSTGSGRLTPPTRPTTNGPSGFSSSSSKRALPTKRRCPSTGAPPASASWPTKRWWTGSASGATAPWSAGIRASGC